MEEDAGFSLILGKMGISACPGAGAEGQSWNFPRMRLWEQGKGFPGMRAGSKGNSRAHSCLAGGQLQEPPGQPCGFPGKHQTASDHGSVPLEHPADRPLGPGVCWDPPLSLLEFLLHPCQDPALFLLEFLLHPCWNSCSNPTRIPLHPCPDPCSIPAGILSPCHHHQDAANTGIFLFSRKIYPCL